jgi:hypothetical protein
LGKFITASVRKGTPKKVITVSNIHAESHFSIKAAYLYLEQPLIILLENSKYDAPFINAIIRNFDDGTLTQAKQEKWWKYDMGGGSSIEQVIEGELDNAFEHAIFTEPKSKYLRYFVLMDSDKKYASDTVAAVESKKAFLTKHKIPYHVLHKREKENYIPKKILLDLNESYFNSFCQLSAPQKDFFDLENGFGGKNQSDKDWEKDKDPKKEMDKKEVVALFQIKKMDKENFNGLKNGIRNTTYAKTFKKTFSDLFDKADKANMLETIQHQPEYQGFGKAQKINRGSRASIC